ncbi:MAG: aminopeptidase P family protein [Planctomycetes bacterium]|nr:aminopeptidase P family protein [Planctomycetota bacterium]
MIATLLALSLLSAVVAPEPSVASPAPATEVPEGMVCGLGKAFHAGRRAALRAAFEEGVFVFRGLPETRDYAPFHQDKTFWYLTGVESPDAALVMDKASGREVLFLPEVSKMTEMWNGEQWDAADAWVRALTGFDDVRPTSELLDVLRELTAGGATLYTSFQPHVDLAGCFDRAGPFDRRQESDPLDGRTSREKALVERLEAELGVKVRDCAPALGELRRVKTPEELEAMRRAARAGVEAMREAMRSTRPDLGEWELEAVMSFVHRREGATGPAYHAIVGGGANSLVLHYSASNRRVRAGEVVLIDYAPEFDHYTVDITRTWPVGGRFSERQAEIYDAVLAAQKAGIAAARPGAKIADVERACADVLKERGFGKLIRHASCHHIGMEVHDVGRSNKVLEPGVAFTIEPGLYEEESGIGVRIEDVVVITDDGCENLTAGAPRERAEIEALIAETGVLDWQDQ